MRFKIEQKYIISLANIRKKNGISERTGVKKQAGPVPPRDFPARPVAGAADNCYLCGQKTYKHSEHTMNYVTVSFLNLFCYLLWGAARYMGYPTMVHVALLAALASLYFTVRMLLHYLRHKADAPQGTVFRICFSFLCIAFFGVYYVLETVLPATQG